MLASLSEGTNSSLYATTCCRKGSNSSDRMMATELKAASVLRRPVSTGMPVLNGKVSSPNSIISNQADSTPWAPAGIVEELQV